MTLIAANPSVLIRQEPDVTKSRFNSCEWFGVNKRIMVGGAGSIGSWLTLLLSRTGNHVIEVWDDDIIEDVNLAGQFYRRHSVGNSKVAELNRSVNDFSGVNIGAMRARIEEGLALGDFPVCISAFDNMAARKIFFKKWKNKYCRSNAVANGIFIDGRMNAENFQVFFVTPDKAKLYEDTHLFDDSEVADLPCSYKYTSHTAAMIASVMTTGFTNWVGNEKVGVDFRELPFKVTYDLSLMLFEKCSE